MAPVLRFRYPVSRPMVTDGCRISWRRPLNTALVRASNHASANTRALQMAPNPRIKVFEDRSEGIVCYRDENGEIVCEGYDEGPRLPHQLPTFSRNQRDAEVVDLLQRCWDEIVEREEKLSYAEANGKRLQERQI